MNITCQKCGHIIDVSESLKSTLLEKEVSKTRKETLFIQMLEGLHKTEAEVLINVKDKKLNKVYKGLTEQLIKETFNWNDDFMKNTK